MSSGNVLPSGPHEDSHLYPPLQPDFRMQKVNDISAALNKEVGHYRTVAKKYKRAKKVVNWSAVGSSVLWAAFSSPSFGSTLSVVGLPATIPLGGAGGAFALASSGLIIASKKLDSKIKKHQEIVKLAIVKRDTVDRLLSKALADNKITNSEFWLIIVSVITKPHLARSSFVSLHVSLFSASLSPSLASSLYLFYPRFPNVKKIHVFTFCSPSERRLRLGFAISASLRPTWRLANIQSNC